MASSEAVPAAAWGPRGVLGAIEEALLGPLRDRPASAWHGAPAGKWTPAQIVEHIVLSLEYSGRTFEERRSRGHMRRRRRPLRALARRLVLGTGWFPPGQKAPELARPGPSPDPNDLVRRLEQVLARFERLTAELLPARGADLFVRHPALGDLTLPEWIRFHQVHTAHHAKQLRERIR